jgi:hypothetical protein
MNIKIEKSSGGYRADCLDLSGSPPVGTGKTKEMAVACLFYLMLFSSPCVGNSRKWTDCIAHGEPIMINGEVWNHIYEG